MVIFMLTVVCIEKSKKIKRKKKNQCLVTVQVRTVLLLGKMDSEWSGYVLTPGVGF